MPRSTAKSIRFTRVVERSGQPHAHVLWVPPEKDPEFKRALDAHRVMTVRPRATGKTDQGFVGFDRERSKGGQFLIFPKSLQPFEGADVIGIKFDLIEQPKIVPADGDREPPPASRRAATAARARAARVVKERLAAAPPASAAEPTVGPAPEAQPTVHRAREPAPERISPPARSRRSTSSVAASTDSTPTDPSPTAAELTREIRAALKELQRGKTVAAYQRLEKAIAAH